LTVPDTGIPQQASEVRDTVLAKQTKEQKVAIENIVGRPVTYTRWFWVEGTWPIFVVALVLGLAAIGGAVGALLGMAAGVLASRVVTRHRAKGLPFQTYLAVADLQLYVIKGCTWRARPGAIIAQWPLEQIDRKVRAKRVTAAVDLSWPDGRRARLEAPALFRSRVLAEQIATGLHIDLPDQRSGNLSPRPGQGSPESGADSVRRIGWLGGRGWSTLSQQRGDGFCRLLLPRPATRHVW
jgi:hypothetical protein